MAVGHAHALYLHGHSRVHAMAPEAKVVATVVLVSSVALTPRGTWSAFAAQGLLVLVAAWRADVPLGFVARRLVVVLPFVAFALAVPFVATGERTTVLGVGLSIEGVQAAGTIGCKALLGASASIVLTASTEAADILRGLERLRVPVVLTTIAAFMLRYAELITAEIARMRMAMTVRGHDPRWLFQARPMASASGALFVRSFERGERVHSAMLARGFTGAMPALGHARASRADWLRAAAVAVPAVAVTTAAIAAGQ